MLEGACLSLWVAGCGLGQGAGRCAPRRAMRLLLPACPLAPSLLPHGCSDVAAVMRELRIECEVEKKIEDGLISGGWLAGWLAGRRAGPMSRIRIGG